jgi:uncharacterized protein with PIN domain
MKITENQIKTLLGFVSKTRDDEISCQACEDQIAQFAESQLTGKEIPEALRAIEEHLKICPECTEELEFIRRALESDVEKD